MSECDVLGLHIDRSFTVSMSGIVFLFQRRSDKGGQVSYRHVTDLLLTSATDKDICKNMLKYLTASLQVQNR